MPEGHRSVRGNSLGRDDVEEVAKENEVPLEDQATVEEAVEGRAMGGVIEEEAATGLEDTWNVECTGMMQIIMPLTDCRTLKHPN